MAGHDESSQWDGSYRNSQFNFQTAKTVIASGAKQSIAKTKVRMDCFVASLLAMTSNTDTNPRSRGATRPSCAFIFRPEK
jgi:hypothetical protein